MQIKWVRGYGTVNLAVPSLWFVQGGKNTGKSSFLEHLAELNLSRGHAIFDVYSSRDGESLAWLRSRWAEQKRILLLKGPGVDVRCSWDVKNADNVTVKDFDSYDLVISSPPLYLSMDQEYTLLAMVFDKLYTRRLSWNRIIYALLREASGFFYSRLRLLEDQAAAKTQGIFMLREMRHCGLSCGLDAIRLLDLDASVRAISDYLVLKAHGPMTIGAELRWLFRYFTPTSMMAMPQNRFVIITRTGGVGYGSFQMPVWHKRLKENILASVGVRIEYGDVPRQAENRGTYVTVADEEHAQIIDLYLNHGLGMGRIAKQLGRSSATVKNQIDMHNSSVDKLGYCTACRRVKAPHEAEKAQR
jgi:hypothetical protein